MIEKLAELDQRATPGPWVGGYLTEATVNTGLEPTGTQKIEPGTCWLDRDYGLVGNDNHDRVPLRVIGDRHWHLANDWWYGIVAPSKLVEVVTTGAWCDGDSGGIASEADGELIAASRNALPLLLEVARCARTLRSWWQEPTPDGDDPEGNRGAIARDSLFAALEALERGAA